MLSVIMPYVNEFPQIVFTVRAVAEELQGVTFEIIVIDNMCPEIERQGYKIDRGHDAVLADGKKQDSHLRVVAQKHPWLKYIRYNEKLSHWNAKNKGVENSQGEILLFLDAHVFPSENLFADMYLYMMNVFYKKRDYTLHAPLAYHILEDKRLIYKPNNDIKKGVFHYSYSSCNIPHGIIEVPCMSTCGMMMSRSTYDKLEGFPSSLGIYGGGENFVNYTMAVLGMKKYIYNVKGKTLFHHGDKREYAWNYNDYHRNRLIATYVFGGEKWARKYAANVKGDRKIIDDIYQYAVTENKERREKVKANQIYDIEEWAIKEQQAWDIRKTY